MRMIQKTIRLIAANAQAADAQSSEESGPIVEILSPSSKVGERLADKTVVSITTEDGAKWIAPLFEFKEGTR